MIVSSQGIDGFAVYERQEDNKFLFSFIIGTGNSTTENGKAIDEVTHTDGVVVMPSNLGPSLPLGAFVAHDDINTEPAVSSAKGLKEGTTPHATYKIVPWEHIAFAPGLPEPLAVNPAFNPRRRFGHVGATTNWEIPLVYVEEEGKDHILLV